MDDKYFFGICRQIPLSGAASFDCCALVYALLWVLVNGQISGRPAGEFNPRQRLMMSLSIAVAYFCRPHLCLIAPDSDTGEEFTES